MANGNDIIIKGSSVDIDYDEELYPKEPGKPRSHKSYDKNITRVTVTDKDGKVRYDSGEDERGLIWEIKAHCRPMPSSN
jgi:hypothetical protein